MSNFLKGLAKFFAVIFAILFSITLITALLLFNIDQQMFKPETYVSALENANIYQNLPELVSRMIITTSTYNPCAEAPLTCENISHELSACYEQALGTDRLALLRKGSEQPTESEKQAILSCAKKFGNETTSSQTGMPAFMQNLTEADWTYLIQSLLPPEDLKSLTESLFNQLFAYLNGDTDSIVLPLDRLKENLSSESGVDALLHLIRTRPLCTLDDMVQIVFGNLPFCNPSEEVLQLIMPLLQDQLNAAAKAIPDQVTVIPPAPGENNSLVDSLKVARFIMRASPMISLAFLFLVTLLAVRTPKDWMRWWGIPLFFAGIIVLAIGVISIPILNSLWLNFVTPYFPSYLPPEISTTAHDVVMAVLQKLGKWIMVEAGIITILGLGAWIGSFLVKPKGGIKSY
jgi:hypothetical protein